MGSNRITEHAQSLLEGVKCENPRGEGKLGNEIISYYLMVQPFIQTHFKGHSTIKNLLVSPKDKDPMVNKSGAIYWYQCGNLGCDDEYIGETSRTFGERYKEDLKASSPIHQHSNQTGHPTSHNNFQIIGREGHNLARNIKESIFIRVNNPTLNNNIGKFNLPHIWDRVLLNTKGLNVKRQVNNNNTQSN